MTQFIGGANALSYMGVKAPNPPNTILAQRNPTAADINHDIGTVWVNQVLDNVYVLTHVDALGANWEIVNQFPLGAAPITLYVVDFGGTGGYMTVQAALDDANAAGVPAVVYVKPGTYVENLTLYADINIQGAGPDTTISGIHVPPAAGNVMIYGCQLTSGTHIFSSAAASAGIIVLYDCLIRCTNGFTFNLVNWTGSFALIQCAEASTNNGVMNNTGGANLSIFDSVAGAGVGQTLASTAGDLLMRSSRLVCPSSFLGAATIDASMGSYFGGTITTAGTTSALIYNSTISTGATAAISQGSAGTIALSNVTITTSNNPAIDGAGAGAINLSGVNFTDGSNLAATLTLSHVSEMRTDKIMCGDDVYRSTTFTGNSSIIQAYADDPTAAGASTLHTLLGDLTVSAGNGNHTPSAVLGNITVIAGGNDAMTVGVHGNITQADGSDITSTAAGVEGEININETGAASIPQYYAFGVKGYFVGDDAAAVPATGLYSGIGSVVEYSTPLNAYAHGYVAHRMGVGAGTAARAAFGVAQGTQAIPDWLYGLDLYNTTPLAAGVAYTNADIRLFDESTIVSNATDVTVNCAANDDFNIDLGDALGVEEFRVRTSAGAAVAVIDSRGDISGRNINVTNTNITSFNVNPILQTKLTTGGAPTGATGDTNIMYLQDGVTMEEFIIGAGQTIIAPRLAADGLLISLDLTNAEGAEYNFGTNNTRARHAYTIGTSPAFFVEASFKVADVSGCEPLLVGFRINSANNAVYTAYADYATIGIKTSANADLITLSTEVGGGGTTDTNTTDAWTDGQTHTVRVNVTGAGVVTYLIDGVAPSAVAAYTFTNALQVVPFIRLEHAAAAPGAIHLISFACGLQ